MKIVALWFALWAGVFGGYSFIMLPRFVTVLVSLFMPRFSYASPALILIYTPIVGGLTILCYLIARGLWRRRNTARICAMIVSSIILIIGIVGLCTKYLAISNLMFVVMIVLYGLFILYLSTKNVERVFINSGSKGSPLTSKNGIRSLKHN